MKRFIVFCFILTMFLIIKGEGFDEYSFMKSVNPKITKRTMRIIKESVDKNYHMVSNTISKKHIYMIMAGESRFYQKATGVSKNGSKDRGLFQVNSDTYKHLVDKGIVKNNYNRLYQIRYNVYIGLFLLRSKIRTIKRKIDYSDDVETLAMMVLIAYNKGVGGLIRDIKDGREDFHNFKYIKHLNKFEKYI